MKGTNRRWREGESKKRMKNLWLSTPRIRSPGLMTFWTYAGEPEGWGEE